MSEFTIRWQGREQEDIAPPYSGNTDSLLAIKATEAAWYGIRSYSGGRALKAQQYEKKRYMFHLKQNRPKNERWNTPRLGGEQSQARAHVKAIVSLPLQPPIPLSWPRQIPAEIRGTTQIYCTVYSPHLLWEDSTVCPRLTTATITASGSRPACT